jgi:putative Mg2+ transporter-C (MgtC) family protein
VLHFRDTLPDIVNAVARELRLELLFQLALAVVLGGAIGLERELRGKPAGLRTNVLICIGATLFTVLSQHISAGRGDPGRIAAQVLTGIGFIGAGTILHLRGSISGLTSAATIWVVTAIGMAVGSSAYVEALGATGLVGLVLVGLGKAEKYLATKASRSNLVIHARPESTALEDLEAVVRGSGLEVERVVARHENVDLVIELTLRGPRRLHDQAVLSIVHHPLVRTVSSGE